MSEDPDTSGDIMNKADYKVAKELKERLSKALDLVDFKVFGSRTRETYDEDSDMDVFIEVEYLDKDLEDKIRDIVWEVGYENEILVSPLVFTRHELEETALRASPIVQNIDEEGVRV